MGFHAPTTLKVIFDEGAYAGAEITCRLNVSLEKVMAYSRLAEDGEDGSALDALMRQFGEEIVMAWNFEDEDGQPLPLTADAFMAQALPLRTAVVKHWMSQVSDIPDPLGAKSNVLPASNGSSKPPDSLVAVLNGSHSS